MIERENSSIPSTVCLGKYGICRLDTDDNSTFPKEVELTDEQKSEIIQVYNEWKCGNLKQVTFGFDFGY